MRMTALVLALALSTSALAGEDELVAEGTPVRLSAPSARLLPSVDTRPELGWREEDISVLKTFGYGLAGAGVVALITESVVVFSVGRYAPLTAGDQVQGMIAPFILSAIITVGGLVMGLIGSGLSPSS